MDCVVAGFANEQDTFKADNFRAGESVDFVSVNLLTVFALGVTYNAPNIVFLEVPFADPRPLTLEGQAQAARPD
jgi:hypothetical protein